MRLIQLKIHNFKKIKDLTIDFKGKDMDIFGANGIGKTTIFDSFMWLLFGKSSLNVSMDDQIKFKDTSGNDLDHGVNHEVEAILEIAPGKQIQLKRIFAEKWTKIKGSAEATFSGHTTEFEVNQVPVRKKDYQEQINKIVNEDTFKLLTNPFYFNTQLHWQERRKILIEVCGDVSDSDVISANEKLKELQAVMGDHSLEDFRKMILAQKSKINKELEKIPVRIDEVNRSLMDLDPLLSEEVLLIEIQSLKKQQSDVNKKIVQIQNGGAIAEKEKQITQIDNEQLHIKNRYDHEINKKALENQSIESGLREKRNRLVNSIAEYKKINDSLMACIEKNGEDIVALRKKWNDVDAETFEPIVSNDCPTCGQHLPADQIEAAKEKLVQAFNLKKAEQLKEINESGKQKKAQMEKDAAQMEGITKSINDTESKIFAIDNEIKELQSQGANIADYHNDEAYILAESKKAALKSEIDELKLGNTTEIQKLSNEVKLFDTEIQARQSKIAQLTQRKENQNRIKELEEQQGLLGKEYERIESQIFLTEEFIQTKVSLIEEKINSKFKIARFKLFEKQINGGLQECCETLGEGVPYSAGLNTAATYNIGLDIIQTLSEHYQFEAPIFIDGSESVTDLIPVQAQTIRLIVSKEDKELRLEVNENELKEAI